MTPPLCRPYVTKIATTYRPVSELDHTHRKKSKELATAAQATQPQQCHISRGPDRECKLGAKIIARRWQSDETAQIHHAAGRRGGDVAARSAGAAAGARRRGRSERGRSSRGLLSPSQAARRTGILAQGCQPEPR
jgi:hypothetical protein